MNLFSKLLLGLDTKAFRSGIANADRSLKKFSMSLKNLGGLIGATFAAQQVASFTKEAINLNSQLEKAAAGFARFGSEVDLQNMRKSTMGLVTDLELMQQSVKGANLGIPIQQMGTLLAFAKRRADETGESIDYLVNSIVEGIGRKSTRRLDNLGITAERVKAAMHGVSLETASVKDVSDAFTSIAKEELDKMGDAALTASDKFAKLSVAWDNFKARTGGPLADVATGVLGLITFGADVQGAQASESAKRREALRRYGSLGNTGAVLKIKPPQAEAPETAIQKEIISLDSLSKKLEEITADFKAAQIASAEFYALRQQSQDLEQQIKDLTDGVVPQTQAIKLQAKATNDVYHAQEKSLMIMRQIPAAGNAYTEWVKGIKAAYEEWNQEIETMNYLGQEFGNILTASFQAALTNGESFFDTIKKGFRNYIIQIAAMTAATTALALAVAFVTGGANFKAAFNNIGGGMGLPFGFDDTGELKFRIAGFGMEASNNRNQRGLNILGN